MDGSKLGLLVSAIGILTAVIGYIIFSQGVNTSFIKIYTLRAGGTSGFREALRKIRAGMRNQDIGMTLIILGLGAVVLGAWIHYS